MYEEPALSPTSDVRCPVHVRLSCILDRSACLVLSMGFLFFSIFSIRLGAGVSLILWCRT